MTSVENLTEIGSNDKIMVIAAVVKGGSILVHILESSPVEMAPIHRRPEETKERGKTLQIGT